MTTSHLDTIRQEAQPSSPERTHASFEDAAPPSPSKPRFMSSNSFRRSSGSFTGGGGMLARFASSSSSRSQSDSQDSAYSAPKRPSIGKRLSSRSRKSIDAATGANLAELSKPNGKFKSGIKWDSQQPAPEPFMETSDSAAAAEQRELASALDVSAALASGSTAAAQAHAQTRGLGQPIFARSSSISNNKATTTTSPSSTLSAKDTSQLPTVSQTISALDSSGIHPDILGTARSSAMQTEPAPAIVATLPSAKLDSSAVAPLETEFDTKSGDGATPCLTPPTKSREASYSDQGSADNHMLARAAQLVLEAARQQARVETRKKGRSAPASPKRSTFNLSPVNTNAESNKDDSAIQDTTEGADSELSRTPSQRARSKSDAGRDTKVKRRKSFLRSMSSKARRERSAPSDGADAARDGAGTPTPSANSPTTASAGSSGTVTPGGRRRRYVDTRDLDLLARELAAEAIAEQVPQPPFARASRSGSSSPHRLKAGAGSFNDPRRRSFPSILEDSPLQDDSIVPASSSSNTLKPMTPLHSSRSSARTRAAESKGLAGTGSASLTPATLSDPTNGLVPKEMFIGLGGSSYPSLPPPSSRANGSTLDGVDPFGIPLTQESSPFDATMAYANKTNVYHTPNQVAVSRTRSNASIGSISPTASINKRRPVLTMTMNDPEAHLQGLTKPPKESSSKRLTPFASRSNSRAPSPSPSFSNLKTAAAAQEPAKELAHEQNIAVKDGDVAASEIVSSVDSKAVTAASAAADGGLRPEEASIRVKSRASSIARSESRTGAGLAPAKPSRMNRLSAIFRTNKSKEQLDTLSSLKAPSPPNNASSSTSPEMSAYATPCGELAASSSLSPQSAAVSSDSDADISPVAFRTLDLPPTQDTTRSSRPTSRPTSGNASRRSSMALDNVERVAAKKRPVRAFLRRLSSFSLKKESKEAKLNVPDASTMPAVDAGKIKQLSEAKDGKAAASDGLEQKAMNGGEGVPTANAAQEAAVDARGDAKKETGLEPALEGLDLSKASPVPVNEEMAKNGFGTRSAYKLGGKNLEAEESGNEIQQVDVAGAETREDAEDSAKEEDAMAARENLWDRSRPGQIVRSDSQTPSSEDSFFAESRPSLTSRPGSGALMKHGSESAISEELHTPDPSTAYLPATKTEEAMLDGATLSSTLSSRVSSVTAAAGAAKVVAAAAGGEEKGPVMTALPDEAVQSA